MPDSDFSLQDAFPPVDRAAWREQVDQDLKGASFQQRLVTPTYEGVDIQPLYTRDDWPAAGDPSGFPGLDPFTRGGRPLGNAISGWTVLQDPRHPEPVEAGARVSAHLTAGGDGVLLGFDPVARAGFDPDAAIAPDRIGQEGTGIWTAADLEQVLAGVDPAQSAIVLVPGAAFLPAAALLECWWQSRDASPEAVRGGFGADPYGSLARDGRLPAPLGKMLDLAADLAAWTAQRRPRVRALTVDVAPYHRAGSDAVQDLAYAMATGIDYLRALTVAGLDLETAAGQLRFTIPVGTHFFKAAAKLRAARTLWAHIVAAAGGSPAARALYLHVRTGRRSMTRRDPWVNMLRNTGTCFAAAVAGAAEVTTEPFDAAIGPPGALGDRIARNTQLVLREESNLHRVVDPGGGAWFLEHLTEELARRAWALVQEIEAAGGMGIELTSGRVAERLAEGFEPRAKNIARRCDPLTGVSEFPNLEEDAVTAEVPATEALLEEAIARVRAVRAQAGPGALEPIAAARGQGRTEAGRLMSAAVEAAQAGATLGGMTAALTDGAAALAQESLPARPLADGFERLRDASDDWRQRTGERPLVFLAGLGSLADSITRLTWARNFFAAGGFEAVSGDGHEDPAQAAAAFQESGAAIAVLCSSDRVYERLAVEVATALKQAGARTVVLAGRPGEREAALRQAGVDRFIHVGCDVLETLRELLEEEGVLS